MLHSEFTQRVKFEVSNEEFEAINVVYMASDLDKDEFCKMWCRMNAKRIKAYKEEQKANENKEEFLKKIYNIYYKLTMDADSNLLINEVLNDKEESCLEKFGIQTTKFSPMFEMELTKKVWQVWHELNERVDEFKHCWSVENYMIIR